MNKANNLLLTVVGILVVIAVVAALRPGITGMSISNITEENATTSFNLSSNVIISITDAAINLGDLGVGETKNSADVADYFTIENAGSAYMTVKVYAVSSPFSGTTTFPGSDFQVQCNSAQSGSCTSAYQNISDGAGSAVTIITNLDASDSVDEMNVGIQVHVPHDEAPGAKSTDVTMLASET